MHKGLEVKNNPVPSVFPPFGDNPNSEIVPGEIGILGLDFINFFQAEKLKTTNSRYLITHPLGTEYVTRPTLK